MYVPYKKGTHPNFRQRPMGGGAENGGPENAGPENEGPSTVAVSLCS